MKTQVRLPADLLVNAAITAVGIIAVQYASVALNTAVITGLLSNGMYVSSNENNPVSIPVFKWTMFTCVFFLITYAASFLPARVARYGVGIGNLLFYIGATTQYSLSASPMWVLSRGQLIAWGWAVFIAITLSVTEIMLARQLAQWRTIHSRHA